MKKRVKKLWLEALRSGKFRQAKRRLRTGASPRTFRYCCLGVLEQLAVEAKIAQPIRTGDAILSPETIKWSGVPDNSPLAGDDCLANLNDNGSPFTVIADLIEKYL